MIKSVSALTGCGTAPAGSSFLVYEAIHKLRLRRSLTLSSNPSFAVCLMLVLHPIIIPSLDVPPADDP